MKALLHKPAGRLTLAVLGVVAAVVIGLAALSALARRPANLGVKDGKFAPCPDTPNCVSSAATDEEHHIAPLRFTGPPAAAMARLQSVVASMSGAAVVTATNDYLHAEFTSTVFRFVDDAEFLLDADTGVVHVRSASRAGRSDLGVNRRRIEEVRRKFEEP